MNQHYVVPDDVFAALAAGGGGEHAMRLLVRAQRSKRLLLLRMVVATASRAGHPRAKELASAYEVLAGAQADRPSDIEPLLCHPPVGAWAIQALRDLRSGAALDHGYLTALAAAAALLVHVDCVIEVPLDGDRLFLPFLGQAHLTVTDPPETATVRSWPEGGEILAAGVRIPIPVNPRLDGDGWQGIRRLTVSAAGLTTSFLLDDLDSYRFPGKRTTGRIDAIALGQWQRTLDDAWALLVAHHPETAEEIAAGITVLVPLHALPGANLSATSRHSFGAVALSQRSDGRSFAVDLAHERQHAKLNALLDLISLIDDPGLTRWYAPWRDDPRPLGALLHGAYAYLGVAAFWRQQRYVDRDETALRAHTEFVRWRDGTRKVVSTLQTSGALTQCGVRFVEGMAASLNAWADEPVPAAALQQAHAAAAEHWAAWKLRHHEICAKERNSSASDRYRSAGYQSGGGSKSKSRR
ncbi:MAG: HEXXH motif domain-containing protein [Egibacteraceae bacterium]